MSENRLAGNGFAGAIAGLLLKHGIKAKVFSNACDTPFEIDGKIVPPQSILIYQVEDPPRTPKGPM